MTIRIVHLLSVFFTSILTAGGLAHVFALPNKIGLPEGDYLIVQQIYRGWALLGVPMFGAMATAAALAFMLRRRRIRFALCLAAALLIGLSLAVFFVFTYPANQQTHNWIMLPENWERLRAQWEYSHAAAAAIDFAALIALVVAGQNLAGDGAIQLYNP